MATEQETIVNFEHCARILLEGRAGVVDQRRANEYVMKIQRNYESFRLCLAILGQATCSLSSAVSASQILRELIQNFNYAEHILVEIRDCVLLFIQTSPLIECHRVLFRLLARTFTKTLVRSLPWTQEFIQLSEQNERLLIFVLMVSEMIPEEVNHRVALPEAFVPQICHLILRVCVNNLAHPVQMNALKALQQWVERYQIDLNQELLQLVQFKSSDQLYTDVATEILSDFVRYGSNIVVLHLAIHLASVLCEREPQLDPVVLNRYRIVSSIAEYRYQLIWATEEPYLALRRTECPLNFENLFLRCIMDCTAIPSANIVQGTLEFWHFALELVNAQAVIEPLVGIFIAQCSTFVDEDHLRYEIGETLLSMSQVDTVPILLAGRLASSTGEQETEAILYLLSSILEIFDEAEVDYAMWHQILRHVCGLSPQALGGTSAGLVSALSNWIEFDFNMLQFSVEILFRSVDHQPSLGTLTRICLKTSEQVWMSQGWSIGQSMLQMYQSYTGNSVRIRGMIIHAILIAARAFSSTDYCNLTQQLLGPLKNHNSFDVLAYAVGGICQPEVAVQVLYELVPLLSQASQSPELILNVVLNFKGLEGYVAVEKVRPLLCLFVHWYASSVSAEIQHQILDAVLKIGSDDPSTFSAIDEIFYARKNATHDEIIAYFTFIKASTAALARPRIPMEFAIAHSQTTELVPVFMQFFLGIPKVDRRVFELVAVPLVVLCFRMLAHPHEPVSRDCIAFLFQILHDRTTSDDVKALFHQTIRTNMTQISPEVIERMLTTKLKAKFRKYMIAVMKP